MPAARPPPSPPAAAARRNGPARCSCLPHPADARRQAPRARGPAAVVAPPPPPPPSATRHPSRPAGWPVAPPAGGPTAGGQRASRARAPARLPAAARRFAWPRARDGAVSATTSTAATVSQGPQPTATLLRIVSRSETAKMTEQLSNLLSQDRTLYSKCSDLIGTVRLTSPDHRPSTNLICASTPPQVTTPPTGGGGKGASMVPSTKFLRSHQPLSYIISYQVPKSNNSWFCGSIIRSSCWMFCLEGAAKYIVKSLSKLVAR